MENHKLKLDDSRLDAILVTGRTGVGKSTLTEILFGDVTALKSTFDEELLCVEIQNTKITSGLNDHSMFQSDTICPQLFTDPTKPGLAIYDCPGFADTRGTSNEIATGVYLSEIVQHAKRVKLVATVDYDTVKPNADRNKFTDGILPEILDFVLSNEIYEGGVFLLVTKYANVSEAEKNKRFPDDVIVCSIVKFLEEAQKHAVKNAEGRKRKAAINALFENSWLQMVDGKYPNIGFSRTIAKSGKLSDMESVTRRTLIRNQILDNPHFSFKPSNRQDFGCPISEVAKLKIRKVEKNLCSEAEVRLRAVGEKIVNKLAESSKNHQQLSSFVHQYIMFLNEMTTLTEAESGLSIKMLHVLCKFSNNVNVSVEDFDRLNSIVKGLKHLSSVDVEQSSAIWKDANGKLKQAKLSMAKDLLMEFRKAQRDLVAEVGQLLKSVGQRVVIKCAKSADNVIFYHFHAFTTNLKELPKEESGLSDRSLEILREFGVYIGEDMDHEVDKLAAIIGCLNYLTEVDAEQLETTWLDVQMRWDLAMDFMMKDITQFKAQREFDKLEAEGKIAIAKAEAEVIVAKTKGELAQALAAIELTAARVAAERAQLEAEKKLILANTEKEMAAARAQAEITAARHRAELAEARAAAARNDESWCSIM